MNQFLMIVLIAASAGTILADNYHDSKDYHVPAHYRYEYGVHDPHTHDHKSQWEHRAGHTLKGGYTVKEADGTTRVVEYHSDGGGLYALVKQLGHAHHPAIYGGKKVHGGGVGGATSYMNIAHYHH